jgi:hypothetical protein
MCRCVNVQMSKVIKFNDLKMNIVHVCKTQSPISNLSLFAFRLSPQTSTLAKEMPTPPPFEFVLDYLPNGIIVKKMFGMYYIYLRQRILLILRKAIKEPEWNGISVATEREHHRSLMTEIPELSLFRLHEQDREGNWLLLKDDNDNFESAAIKICELISAGDPRIGRFTQKSPIA